jgi:hypothetical protein
MISVGPCPVCKSGQVGFRVCANREKVVLLCDQCALVWMHPNQITPEKAEDPMGAEFARRHPDARLRPSRWAESEDVQHFGWGAYLLTVRDILEPG